MTSVDRLDHLRGLQAREAGRIYAEFPVDRGVELARRRLRRWYTTSGIGVGSHFDNEQARLMPGLLGHSIPRKR